MSSQSPNPQSDSRLSTRISIRWIPEPASETTDTVVMSVKGWYVDLRVDKTSGDIDWAIAGQRIVDSQESSRVQFTHEIDSHNSFNVADCGTFSALPNGDDLEIGSMTRPDKPGAPVTKYEEVWRELTFREGPEGLGKGISWVLESKHNIEEGEEKEVARTFLARVWGTYIVIRQTQNIGRSHSSGDISVKDGMGVSARREEWDSSAGWVPRYVLPGKGEELPSMKNLDGEGTGAWRTPGATVIVSGEKYTVQAFEEIV
ncbi:uncharacterized protein KD926_010166 [Aspergillus affinis]|uniref:uncharacterized protein n=1 Tax=Aspergillus affinis TaxID=1070780 RepID=UPI0022FE4E83|nr:uncharacterized protein KD926_010166 [Aspergillus affinis]KAI9038833.1 hypothetical protein KD926_010166 [Aspergillus affinis]